MVAEEGLPWSAGCCGASRTIVSVRSRRHISRRGDFLTPAGLLASPGGRGEQAGGRRPRDAEAAAVVRVVSSGYMTATTRKAFRLTSCPGTAADGGRRAGQLAAREQMHCACRSDAHARWRHEQRTRRGIAGCFRPARVTFIA